MTNSHSTACIHEDKETQHKKNALRKQMRLIRKEKNKNDLRILSKDIEHTVIQHIFWKIAKNITLYMPLDYEVDTELLLAAALQEDKTVYLPRVSKDRKGDMEFVPYTYTTELVTTTFHLKEPHPRFPGTSVQESRNLFDLILLPGLAFDIFGYRLGYGGGYFDRFFSINTRAKRIGLCFSFQMLQYIPHTTWDKPVDCVVTEDQLICV